MLLDLTRRLVEPGPLEDALQAVTDAALKLVEADHASIRLLDVGGVDLLAGARSGTGSHHAPMSFQRGVGILGWVVSEGQAVCISRAQEDPRFLQPVDQGFSIESIVATPLWSGGKVVGVLSVTSQTSECFTTRDVEMIRLVANCTVAPIERSRLERLSITDDCTSAYNQRYLWPRLEDEMARARKFMSPLSMLLLDLDHFKRVNDAWGHQTGDEVLAIFADRSREQVRRNDVLVRRGGEEFVLIMPDTGLEEAEHVAERIRKVMDEQPIRLDADSELRQCVSIGVATWDGEEPPAAFEARADQAMYQAKAAGRNRVVSARSETGDKPELGEK